MKLTAIRGTHDVLPDAVSDWRRLEEAVHQACRRFGYKEIRTPILEHTRLFHRSVGEATDIVEKQMFTFDAAKSFSDNLWNCILELNPHLPGEDRSKVNDLVRAAESYFRRPENVLAFNDPAEDPADRARTGRPRVVAKLIADRATEWLGSAIKLPSAVELEGLASEAAGMEFSLRPEITAPVVRAVIEHDLLKQRGFWKLYYLGPAFRKERPQKGRLRQFHQFGVEAIGSRDPRVDAESMLLFAEILRSVGVTNFEVRLNSIGCDDCRPSFRSALRTATQARLDRLCPDCRRRIDRNVLRLLDCKVEGCKAVARDLPTIGAFLCAGCRGHDESVRRAVGSALPLRMDPTLVRGLDYYTQTVYEFVSPLLGAQDALGGGGRYNNLVRQLGGPDVGAVGFAAGLERVLIAIQASRSGPPAVEELDFYAVAVEEGQRGMLFEAVGRLRASGLSGTMDFEGRSLKAQMRSANKLNARFALILGPDEAARRVVKVKNLRSQGDDKEEEVSFDEVASKLARRR